MQRCPPGCRAHLPEPAADASSAATPLPAPPRHPQAASKKRGSSRGVSAGAPDPDSDWDVFSALFGRPRTASERRKFGRVWREWERAAEHARQSAAGSSGFASSWSGGGSRGSRHDLFDSSGDEREGSSQRGSAGSAGSGSWTKGSAGASAGPRWGQANWTWDDFRDPSASNRSHSRSWQEDFAAGFAAYEGWCDAEPPNQGRQRTGSGSSSSSAWGWRASGTSWQHDRSTWQHGGGGSATSMSVHGHLSVLGLGRSWLGTRCGKALRHAFLRKAKADHPDVHAAAGAGAVAAAKERFQAAQDAYAQLLVLVQA